MNQKWIIHPSYNTMKESSFSFSIKPIGNMKKFISRLTLLSSKAIQRKKTFKSKWNRIKMDARKQADKTNSFKCNLSQSLLTDWFIHHFHYTSICLESFFWKISRKNAKYKYYIFMEKVTKQCNYRIEISFEYKRNKNFKIRLFTKIFKEY